MIVLQMCCPESLRACHPDIGVSSILSSIYRARGASFCDMGHPQHFLLGQIYAHQSFVPFSKQSFWKLTTTVLESSQEFSDLLGETSPMSLRKSDTVQSLFLPQNQEEHKSHGYRLAVHFQDPLTKELDTILVLVSISPTLRSYEHLMLLYLKYSAALSPWVDTEILEDLFWHALQELTPSAQILSATLNHFHRIKGAIPALDNGALRKWYDVYRRVG